LIDGAGIASVNGALDRTRALQQRSILVAEAAKSLRKPPTMIRPWIGSRLDLDPETDATWATYVTRESVERVRIGLAAAPKRPKGLPGR
jgi:hypothetical protein